MKRSILPLAFLLPVIRVVCIGLMTFLPAVAAADYFPPVTNGKGSTGQYLPLGPLGAAARLETGAVRARVTDVASGGPAAKAKLAVGDWITSANGNAFTTYGKDGATGGDGFPRELGMAILACQASGKPLQLTVEREGHEGRLEVAVALPPMPDFAPDFPAACPRSAALIDAAKRELLEMRQDNGVIGRKKSPYPNAFAALALLSTGDRKCLRTVRDVVDSLADSVRDNGPSASNWHCAATGILLAEYALATGDDSRSMELEACCRAVEQRVAEGTGRLGHKGTNLPYGGKALVITSMHAHLMWALAAHVGIIPDQEKWDLSYKSIKAAMGPAGNIGYNFSARGPNQSMARTGGTLTALRLAGCDRADQQAMAQWITANPKRTTNCHAVTSMGLIFGMMGSKAAGPEVLRANFDYHRWLFALVAPYDPEHGAYYFAKRANIGGDGYLGYRTVANYQVLLMLNAARDDTLWCFGNRTKAWIRR